MRIAKLTAACFRISDVFCHSVLFYARYIAHLDKRRMRKQQTPPGIGAIVKCTAPRLPSEALVTADSAAMRCMAAIAWTNSATQTLSLL